MKLTDLYLTAAFHNDNYYNAGSKLFALIICFHFYIFKLKEVKLFSYYYNFLSEFSYNVLVHLWRPRVIIPRNHIRNEATTTTTSISNSALLQTSLNYFPIWNPSLKVFFSFDTLLPKCVHDFKDRIIFVENFRNQRTVKLRVSRYSNVVFKCGILVGFSSLFHNEVICVKQSMIEFCTDFMYISSLTGCIRWSLIGWND